MLLGLCCTSLFISIGLLCISLIISIGHDIHAARNTSTRTQNLDSLIQIQIAPAFAFEFAPRDAENVHVLFCFCWIVEGVAFSAETGIQISNAQVFTWKFSILAYKIKMYTYKHMYILGRLFFGQPSAGHPLSGLRLQVQSSYLMQHTATHCNTLQHAATHCNTLQHTQHTATHCNTLQHALNFGQSSAEWAVLASAIAVSCATNCNILQHTATYCDKLQHTATHCNILQHTATHYHCHI